VSARPIRYLPISLAFAVALALVAGYQVVGVSRDYTNYLDFFSNVIASIGDFDLAYRFEPGFSLSVYLLALAGLSPQLIYCSIVFVIVLMKYLSLSERENYWVALLIFSFYFLARYFVLFEMTVLRAACAFAFAFFVFFRKSDYKIRATEVLVLLLAITFHYSAAIFLLIYFAGNLSRRRVLFISCSVFLIVLSFKSTVVSILPQYLNVFGTYEEFGPATLLPVPYLIDLIYLGFIILYWNKNDVAMKYCALGLSIGAALHFSLLDYSLLAGRFRELTSVFVLIYVVKASTSGSTKVRYFSWLYVFSTGILNMYATFVHDPLLS